MRTPLLLAPLLLTGCFDLTTAVALDWTGRTSASIDFVLAPEAVTMLQSFAPDVAARIRGGVPDMEQLGLADAFPPGAQIRSRRLGSPEAHGVAFDFDLDRPTVLDRNGKDVLLPIRLVELERGRWELSWAGAEGPAQGFVSTFRDGLGKMVGRDAEGAASLLASLPPIQATTRLTVPGVVESVEPATATVSGSTVTCATSSAVGAPDGPDLRCVVRFRAQKGFRPPTDPR